MVERGNQSEGPLWTRENRILVGAVLLGTVVGQVNPELGGVILLIGIGILARKGYRRLTGGH